LTIALAAFVRALRSGDGDPAGDDARWVDRCLAGERRAFDALYRRHASAVYGRLTRLIGRSADTEDLVQQVFLEAFRSLGSFRGDAAFGTWLYRITVHVAMGALRRQRRRPSVAVAPDEMDARAGGELSPEAAAGERELYALALAHLDGLKPDQRVAFVLRHVECLSLDEIGAMVGATAPAVGARVKKAERVLVDRIARAEKSAARRRNSKESDETRMS
jgi:RNA polymerase sigma-70 factor (ECF subfamily)